MKREDELVRSEISRLAGLKGWSIGELGDRVGIKRGRMYTIMKAPSTLRLVEIRAIVRMAKKEKLEVIIV